MIHLHLTCSFIINYLSIELEEILSIVWLVKSIRAQLYDHLG